MRLISLELNNFRQFAGRNTINFGEDNKVTIIYGLNGYGKTGIFRAIIFCLYGKTYLDRDHLDTVTQRNKGLNLVNETLIEKAQGDYVTASVTLKFEHNDSIYELFRSIYCAKIGNSYEQQQGEVKLTQTQNGSTKSAITDYDEVKQILNSIIDQKNKDLFLFDGEQMEELTKTSEKSMKEVKQGITDLLRLDAIKKVKDEFQRVEKDVERKIRDNSLSAELEKVNEDIIHNERSIEETTEALNSIEEELKVLEQERISIADKIRTSKDGAIKQKEKDSLQEEIRNIDDELSGLRKRMKDSLKIIPACLGESIVNEALDSLQQRADRGELPSNIKDDFIKELLARGKCICGNNLNEHPEAVEILKEYLNQSVGKFAEAGFNVFQMTKTLSQKIDLRINRDIEEINLAYNTKKNEKERFFKKIQIIDEELKDFVDTKMYAIRDSEIEKELNSNREKKGAYTNQLNQLQIKKEELYKKRETYTIQDERLSSYQKQLSLLNKSKRALNDVYTSYSDDLRYKLSKCATEIMKNIADKETLQSISRIEISDDFIIKVLSPSNIDILSQISSGQRQLVSISYICSLMQVASGLKMPLLMDTPFGRLSGAPRDACLQKLPSILTQWILLTTDTEFTTVEAEALKKSNAWGKIYELVSNEGVSKIVEKDINNWKPTRSTI